MTDAVGVDVGRRVRAAREQRGYTQGRGHALYPSTLQNAWSRRLKLAGLPPMHFHDLRHGASSLWLAMGVQPRVVMEMLGHEDLDMTMRIYQHVTPELLAEASERMDAALGARLGVEALDARPLPPDRGRLPPTLRAASQHSNRTAITRRTSAAQRRETVGEGGDTASAADI